MFQQTAPSEDAAEPGKGYFMKSPNQNLPFSSPHPTMAKEKHIISKNIYI